MAETVLDAGPSFLGRHWHRHDLLAVRLKTTVNPNEFGTFFIAGSSLKYVEPRSPDHSFTLSCEELIGNTRVEKHEGMFWVDVEPGNDEHFSINVISYGNGFGTGSPEGIPVPPIIDKAFKEPCANALESEFKNGVVTAWRAAHEADPFASIRGDFDLTTSTGTWKSKLQLPNAAQCYLVKSAGSSPQVSPWLYLCQLRPTGYTYEKVATLVQSALNISYRPDESASSVSQVYFEDPSKEWRLVLTKVPSPLSVVLRIGKLPLVSAPLDTIAPGFTNTSSSSGFGSGSSIKDQVDAIVRSGQYSAMPAPTVNRSVNARAGHTLFNVRNDTAYDLTVMFSGATDQQLQVAPHASSSIDLAAGNYRVVGRVAAPNVLPAYREDQFESGGMDLRFYIQ
jgi:hypothetical protein